MTIERRKSDRRIPPALAEFAVSQLAEAGELAAIDLTVQNVEILRQEIVKRDARIAELTSLCAELYQVLGALDAPAHVLDKVSAAASGEPIPDMELLPFAPTEQQCGGVVLPERDDSLGTSERDEYANGYRHGWNAYHDAAKDRLNQPCECVAVPRELLEHVIHARRELTRMDRAPLHIRQKLAQKLTDMIAQQGKAVGDE